MTEESRVETVSHDHCDRKIADVMDQIDCSLREELRDWVWLRHGITL